LTTLEAMPASQRSSAMIGSTGTPRSPPALLTSSTAISTARAEGLPKAAAVPLSGTETPSGTFPEAHCVGQGSAARSADAAAVAPSNAIDTATVKWLVFIASVLAPDAKRVRSPDIIEPGNEDGTK
jgi:hypothetical protein